MDYLNVNENWNKQREVSSIIQRVKPSHVQSNPIEGMRPRFQFLSKAWNKFVFGMRVPLMVSGGEQQGIRKGRLLDVESNDKKKKIQNIQLNLHFRFSTNIHFSISISHIFPGTYLNKFFFNFSPQMNIQLGILYYYLHNLATQSWRPISHSKKKEKISMQQHHLQSFPIRNIF